jgi:hypothetical protein
MYVRNLYENKIIMDQSKYNEMQTMLHKLEDIKNSQKKYY